ncbi:MAG: arginine--tRNA ligase [Chitinivibrionales bacterium]|nr:arginine--tRNA ligase [Chitinivibrionales bacterium]
MKHEIALALQRYLPETVAVAEVETLLETPPDHTMGDFALPCFSLAKKLRRNPKAIAEELAKAIVHDETIARAEANNGYCNLYLDRNWLTSHVISAALTPGFGAGTESETIVIEYCSPNTNKPLHLGHLRNMAIGESVSRILAYRGNKTIKACVFNDRGVHICKSMLAYQSFGNDVTPAEKKRKPDHLVGDFYVLFAQKAKTDPLFEQKAQDMLQLWEEGNQEVVALWKKMNGWVFEGFNQTFQLFNVVFDRQYFESELYKFGRDIILDGVGKNLFSRLPDGAVVADLTPYGLDEKVLLRANGTSVYIVQDIYLAYLKYREFSYDRSIYVVGNEQEYHFKVLAALLDKLGNDKHLSGIHHLSYGMVELPEGKMKSREGTIVDADDLINGTQLLAQEEVRKRYELDDASAVQRSLAIALAAIKYQLLKTETAKNMIFNPKEAIRFEGDTGPYILYSYARASSILHKAGKEACAQTWQANEFEAQLLKKIAQFPLITSFAASRLTPSTIAVYVFELCQLFNEFYHECPVLRSELADQRIGLVAAFRNVCGQCLDLLGIEKIEEM